MDFPGKILLLGEYGILLQSAALSVPFARYSGRFRLPEGAGEVKKENDPASRAELFRLLRYLVTRRETFSYLEPDRFESDLGQGLRFDSTIPQGAGLGSSGALTAALYARYSKEGDTAGPAVTRERLAAIESCFHGQSSGIDPLTSLLKKPVLTGPQPPFCSTPDLSRFLETYSIYLVDTHQQGNTGELVAHFLQCCKDPGYRRKMESVYLPLLAETTEAMLTGDFGTLDDALNRLEHFQLACFDKMIPPSMRKFFGKGAGHEECHFKLCGSGGGGRLLVLSRNRRKTENYLTSNNLSYSEVQPAGILTQHLFT